MRGGQSRSPAVRKSRRWRIKSIDWRSGGRPGPERAVLAHIGRSAQRRPAGGGSWTGRDRGPLLSQREKADSLTRALVAPGARVVLERMVVTPIRARNGRSPPAFWGGWHMALGPAGTGIHQRADGQSFVGPAGAVAAMGSCPAIDPWVGCPTRCETANALAGSRLFADGSPISSTRARTRPCIASCRACRNCPTDSSSSGSLHAARPRLVWANRSSGVAGTHLPLGVAGGGG